MRVKYKGHEIDIYISLEGYVAYLDNDLEPQTISKEEYIEYATNGEFISFFKD
jgi:hypothetical protein